MEELQPALNWIESNGYCWEFAPGLFEVEHQFAGSDEVRQEALQWCLNHPTADAIWCARGGYGTARILNGLDWTHFTINPKWIIGFSDVTALHGEANRLGFSTVHATMPIQVPTCSPEALSTLTDIIRGNAQPLSWNAHSLNKTGTASGTLVGGNLSVLYSNLGSPSEPILDGTILFMEDLDEYLYHIDRMMLNLTRNEWWNKVAGVVIGGMTDMNDNTVPFGENAEQIIHRHLSKANIPVAFGAPAGHQNDNRALQFGRTVQLEVADFGSKITYL